MVVVVLCAAVMLLCATMFRLPPRSKERVCIGTLAGSARPATRPVHPFVRPTVPPASPAHPSVIIATDVNAVMLICLLLHLSAALANYVMTVGWG